MSSCLRDDGQGYRATSKASHIGGQGNPGMEKNSGSDKWGQICIGIVIAVGVLVCAIDISQLWRKDTQDTPKKNWEQMSGNDGKFWKGSPDDSVYNDMEGVRCYSYYQYFYDSDGRLLKINTFHPHDYYEDVWVLSDEETYEYDSQGRISIRTATSGNAQWVYEYTEEGHTEVHSWSYMDEDLIGVYDLAGNQIYYRNAGNYRYPHATTYEYDEKNRLVQKILEVEGKPPYGTPPCVILTIEYDDENYTAVETEYDWDGEVTHIWHNTYDEEWRKIGSSWYSVEDIPRDYSAEECADFYTKGYWASYSEGRLTEEMSNEPYKTSHNDSKYCAYDYDGNGNCIMELTVYRVGIAGMNRYVYDEGNRLTEKYVYDLDDAAFWERMQSDGSRLTLKCSDDESLSITRTRFDGTLINQFVYGEYEVDVQYTPTETIYWQNSPSLMAAGNPQGTENDSADIGQQKPGDFTSTETDKAFLYTVEPGDCLWRLAERFMGDGWKYKKIYRQNRDVIGDNPRLILPGTRLYIETE